MGNQSLNPMQPENSTTGGMASRRLDVGALFLSMALLLIATVAGTYWIGELAIKDRRTVGNVHSTIDLLNDVLSSYREAETGQRGYLLTRDDSYLAPYNNALPRIPPQLANLDADARAGLLSQQDVDELRRLGDLKLDELKKTIDLNAQAAETNAAIALVRTDVGKRYMDDIRALVHRMILQKEKDYSELQLAEEHMSDFRTAAFGATTIINLVFLLWAFNRIRDEIRNRQIATDNLAREQRLTAVTLASIGDAVIVTDAAGRITFLNRIAEVLTGWSNAEALGQPCDKIFNIINETTRQITESPIEKVIATGLVQGLANHTLLIRKDGSEVPIDDSGAPFAATMP